MDKSNNTKFSFNARLTDRTLNDITIGEICGPLFYESMPNGKEHALSKRNEECEVSLWFERRLKVHDRFIQYDIDELKNDELINDRFIQRQGFVDAGLLFGEVELFNTDDSIIESFFNSKISDYDYEKISKKLIKTIVCSVNKLVDILKFSYGQYWLNYIDKWDSRNKPTGIVCKELNIRIFNKYNNEWKPFVAGPLTVYCHGVTIELNSDYSQFLNLTDWLSIKKNFEKNTGHSSTLKYVQKAFSSFRSKNYNESFIQIVTAVEFAIDEYNRKKQFDKNGKYEKYFKKFSEQPLNYQFLSLCIHRNLCSEVQIERCESAIKLRNKVVHEGFDVIYSKEIEVLFYSIAITILKFIDIYGVKFPNLETQNVFRPEK
ncbi:MAG: hypothetical protein ACOYMD_13950 [Paludibacter sp.]